MPRDVVWNLFSLANLLPKLSQNICLGKGPNKTYADFLARLETAISHSVIREETKIQLEKLLTYENANQECQRAVTPINETRTVIDYLKACCNLGSETHKIQTLAKTMAAAFKKGNEEYFVNGDKTHLKKDCLKKHAKNIKINKK